MPPQETVFLSYLPEDAHRVTELRTQLEKSGAAVADGRQVRRPGLPEAIAASSLFVACFSANGHHREELQTAIDQLQALEHDRAWFVAVRLTPCEIPPLQITQRLSVADLVVEAHSLSTRLRPPRDASIETSIEIGRALAGRASIVGSDIEGHDRAGRAQSTRIRVEEAVVDNDLEVTGTKSRSPQRGTRND